jgi:putative serine protease PepD
MAALVVVAALVGGIAGGLIALRAHNSGLTIVSDSAAPQAARLPNGVPIPTLVKQVVPSIVSIDVRNNGSEDQGTGMIISSDGQVITNNHVIALAASGGSITVTQSGSTTAQAATLVGTDPSSDVALLRIEGATGLRPVVFGNSSLVQVGDATVAIGNALGLAAGTPTVTQGIVSALGRTVTAANESTNSSETLTNMIQTDAAINPGNSGGALLDAAGAVIGMNTAVAGASSSGQSAQNIGFAIPAAKIKFLLPGLEAGGISSPTSHKGYLGVEIATMTPDLKHQYHLTPKSGAVVLSVIPGSPAAKGGLVQGDVIVSLDGNPITSAEQVTSFTQSHHPGDVVTVGIYRGTDKKVLHVTLGSASG